MNANRHFEDDDLALYAMRLLAEPEASEVARDLAENEQTRARLAAVHAHLGAYAEVSVPLLPAPDGSLDRLLGRIAEEKQDKKVLNIGKPATVPTETTPRRRTGVVLPWISWAGWAVAATLAITAGKLYHDRTALHSMLTAQTGAVVHLSNDRVGGARDMDDLNARLAEQTRQIEQLTAGIATARNQGNNLQASLANQTSKLGEQTARLKDQTAATSAAANELAATERERDTLRGTIAAQAGQVARLNSEAARARQVLDALTDRSALRVTLTKPKSQAAPTGRATYVLSRGTLVFLANNLAPLKANKVYQLWIMPADGSSPVPAGTFTPDAAGNASLVYPQFPRAVAAKGFAVTIENEGGAQKPTLPIILSGASGA